MNLDLLAFVTDLNILLSLFFRELDECLSLNLILKTASADPGITLSAWLSILIFVTSRLEGWKFFVPLSSFKSLIFFKILIKVLEGLLALCG